MALPKRDTDGYLPTYTWPGGYPMYYLTQRGDVLCPDCATDATNDPECDDPPVAGDVHWEGPPLTCDACGAEIDSAYGDPDSEGE